VATLATKNLTLADLARRYDPKSGKIAKIVELLNEDHEILDDAVFVECNDGTNHKTTVRNGLPSGTWRRLYGGVQSTKSSTEQVVDSTGMLEMLPHVDVDLVDKSKDKAGTLMSEHTPHLEGMRQDVEATLFYGDTDTYPDRFMGLHPRYNVLDAGDDTLSGYNVLGGGGTGSDNTSIFLVGWGDQGCHMLYPEGSKAGLSMENLGKELYDADDSSGKFLAYVTRYKWDLGLCVRNWKTTGRICNIDVSALEAMSSAADLIKLMIRLSERVKLTGLRPAFYMHERVRTMLRLQILNHTNTNLTFETIEGRKVMMFDGIPVRKSESILLTEAAIS